MYSSRNHTFPLWSGITSDASSGAVVVVPNARKRIVAYVDGTGAVSGSWNIYASADGVAAHEELVCTLSPTGTGTGIDSTAMLDNAAQMYRAVKVSLTGTDAVGQVILEAD